jgi:hypothetical protein
MMTAERRKEPRHVVIDVEVMVDDRPCTIVDISRSGVRLLRQFGSHPAAVTAKIVFTLADDGPALKRSFQVVGRLVRASDVELVYVYAPPCPDWEALLRRRDTFAQTELLQL